MASNLSFAEFSQMWLCANVALYLFMCVCTDPAPLLQATQERLAELQRSAPDGDALLTEISEHWRKHLECLDKAGQSLKHQKL